MVGEEKKFLALSVVHLRPHSVPRDGSRLCYVAPPPSFQYSRVMFRSGLAEKKYRGRLSTSV